jgi:hypothetical protein
MTTLTHIKALDRINRFPVRVAEHIVQILDSVGYEVSPEDAFTIWDHHTRRPDPKAPSNAKSAETIAEIFLLYTTPAPGAAHVDRVRLVPSEVCKSRKIADSKVLVERLRTLGYDISLFDALLVWTAYSVFSPSERINKLGKDQWRLPVDDSKLLSVFDVHTNMPLLKGDGDVVIA